MTCHSHGVDGHASTLTLRVLLKYMAGCLFFALGAYLFICSEMGTDPLDTFALGVLLHLPLTIGVVQFAVAAACVGAVAAWTRRLPQLSPMVTFFLCGSLIDLQMWNDWGAALRPGPVMLSVATVCCALGSALIIMSGFGIRAMDLVAIQALRAWRVPFWAGKGILEFLLLGAGVALGGPVGIGTAFFFLGVVVLIQPLIWLGSRSLNLVNRGMPSPASTTL